MGACLGDETKFQMYVSMCTSSPVGLCSVGIAHVNHWQHWRVPTTNYNQRSPPLLYIVCLCETCIKKLIFVLVNYIIAKTMYI